ncbi:hypothetical protein CRG98_048530, partial [Punica granatum]
MASDSHPRYRALVIAAICATTSVLVAAFLGARKRWHSGNSSRMNVNNSQQQQHQQEVDGSHDVPSSESSDDPAAGHEVEVFLSFRGTDIRKAFTDYLYHSLIDAG